MKRLFLCIGFVGGTLVANQSQAMSDSSSCEKAKASKPVLRAEALKYCCPRAKADDIKRIREKRLRNLFGRLFYGDTKEIPAIYQAIIEKDLGKIRQLVACGTDINSRDHHQRNPLIVALILQNLKEDSKISEIVDWLIKNSSDVCAWDDSGKAPLHYAVTGGKLSIVESLLQSGADINQKDILGRTPIFDAASNGNIAMTNYLIGREATPKIRDNYGRTPIFYAAVNGFLDIVKLLFAADANPNIKDYSGRSSISYAVESGSLEMVEWLRMQGADLSVRDKSGRALISYAAERGHLNMIDWLRLQGADLSVRDNFGTTLISYAAIGGHLNVMEYLFSEGTELNAFDDNARTPLFYSIMHGNLPASEWLFRHDCALNEKDRFGRTALHYVAMDGKNVNLINWLFKKILITNIDLADNDGKTPLHYATEFGDNSSIRCLVEHGADINATDNEGHFPIYYSIMKRDSWSVSYLISKQANIEDVFHKAIIDHDVDLAKFLIACKADPNALDEKKCTPLIYSVLYNCYPIAKIFVMGEIQDGAGRTALHYASSFGKHDLIKEMFQNGDISYVDIPDNDERTPLHYAACKGHINAAKCLLAHGADINALDSNKRTPLSYVPQRAENLRQFLIQNGAHE